MRNRSRLLVHLTSLTFLLVTGCEKTAVAPETTPLWKPGSQVISTTAPITGIWSAVVTNATDLNNASFGRPASDWVGRTVTGSFSIHLAAPNVGDRNASPNIWEFGPVPGPGPFIEFVTVTALIDGKSFQTSSAPFTGVFFGDVVGISTLSFVSTFNPQDSHVGFNANGIARDIVGFDSFFGPGGVTFDGTNLTIDPGLLRSGTGLIDDLQDSGGTILRQGSIFFRLTKVALSPTGGLLGIVIDLGGRGLLQPDHVTALVGKLNEIALKFEAGNSRAACNQLGAFLNQVTALINAGHLAPSAAQPLIDEVQLTRVAQGC